MLILVFEVITRNIIALFFIFLVTINFVILDAMVRYFCIYANFLIIYWNVKREIISLHLKKNTHKSPHCFKKLWLKHQWLPNREWNTVFQVHLVFIESRGCVFYIGRYFDRFYEEGAPDLKNGVVVQVTFRGGSNFGGGYSKFEIQYL